VNLGLDDKAALVCGASRGLGRAVAAELASEGASVAICARSPEPLEHAATAIQASAEVPVVAIAADLSVPGEPTRVVEEAQAHFGRLDILVANTGGPPTGTFDDLGLADWDDAVALLIRSVVELTAAALPSMKRRRFGRILAITSIAAKQPVDNLMLSNALRPAVTGLAHALAREVAQHGITVNTILPGYTNTERLAELRQADSKRGLDPSSREREIEAEIPLGRFADPPEFAALAAFLVSERASYITGVAFSVDGGWIRGLP
jgi:3-oxoacyl-[acyl-carrier protein] reductase